jgi:hypothetical protein
MVFRPKTLDFDLSPYTGLTRDSWIEAGIYLLEGMFQNIKHFEDPVVMPRKETKITYPHLHLPEEIQEVERKAEMFEGLTRSFFIAAPLIHINPQLELCGYRIRDYYKNQVLKSCTKGNPAYVGTYEDLQAITNHQDPFRAFQQTVETSALVICLWISKEEIWDTFTQEEKDRVAKLLLSFAHANTVPQNWRLFNMLDMAFLHMEGYQIDKEIMADHAMAILNYYVGDGWYRDGHSFDYYSCWAFNVYAPLWNLWYGYEHEPYIAKKFEENSNKLMETYADFFDQDGFTNMWGRSNIYRNASTSAFDGNMFLKESRVNHGLARRIASGSLLQFLTREDFRYKGVPTLGFYGQFSPLVQGYSCAESPFWMGKAFLCLHLPADHPFWTAKENNGTWENLGENEVKETVLNGPALCFSNHKANGETILRTGKVVKNLGDNHGMWNYSKLSFNTKYPWEATPVFEEIGSGIKVGEIEAQQYVLKDTTSGELQKCNVTFWCGSKKEVLYRRQFFNYNLQTESQWIQGINLADFTVPYGIVRVDQLKLFRRPISLTLGAYGFPDNGTEIIKKEKENAKAIILKGSDFTGKKRQLAMTIYDGWSDLDYLQSKGTNPDSEQSLIVFASTTRKKQYGGYESYILISQVITKDNHEEFTEDELFPILNIEYGDKYKVGAYGITRIYLKDGKVREIDFEGMEANMSL